MKDCWSRGSIRLYSYWSLTKSTGLGLGDRQQIQHWWGILGRNVKKKKKKKNEIEDENEDKKVHLYTQSWVIEMLNNCVQPRMRASNIVLRYDFLDFMHKFG